MSQDPTELSRWRPLRVLLAAMDDEIASVYAERGLAHVKPRYVMPLIRLGRRGPMTIKALAESLQVTHSAMSQTVAALRREGFVDTQRGADARTREITLTDKARELVPFFEAEWLATEQAIADLEEEIPYPLTKVVEDIAAALANRSFYDRLASRL